MLGIKNDRNFWLGLEVSCLAHVHKRMVISLPITLIIDTETELRNSNQVFSKCDRLPQSQLVQVGKIEDGYFFLSA